MLFLRRAFKSLMCLVAASIWGVSAFADNQKDLDADLVEVIETIKKQATNPEQRTLLRNNSNFLLGFDSEDAFFVSMNEIFTSLILSDADELRKAVSNFSKIDSSKSGVSSEKIVELYNLYANALEENKSVEEIEKQLLPFLESGEWFQEFLAYQLSFYSYANFYKSDNHITIQKAQEALSVIPPIETELANFARIEMTSVLAHTHNVKGNTKLAISTTQEYLRLTKYNFDPNESLNLLNNLLYSHLIWRDTVAQEYLANALLELEKTLESEAPGLTELRVAQTKVEVGEYGEALEYSILAFEKASLPQLRLQAKVTEATALAGLNKVKEAEAIIDIYQLNISPDRVLNEKSSNSVLQLAFLMALKSGDDKLAITLSNRRLQLLSQNFLTDAASDTSSVLASLENSRERQEERAAAAAREAALLELTIVKQRKLNRTLMALLGLAGLALIGLVAFLKFRERTMKELAIKRKEAASADQLKTDFLGMISHELRTPLNGVIGFSDLLSQTHPDPDVRQKTGVILKSGHELLDVVESMTDMARIDAGQMNILPEDSDLPDLLEEVVEPLKAKAEKKNLAFTHYIDPDLGQHFVDGQRLQQCVRTVLSNAVSFTEIGRVHMHVTTQKSSDDGVTGVTINIADTGVGMSELVQSRLFTPFMQADTSLRRSHMGTGLSLAIAKALVVMMGGELTVVSRIGRGSEFTLTFPLAEPKNAHVETDLVDDIEQDEARLEQEMPAPLPPPVLDLMQPVAGRDTAPLHTPPQKLENNLDGLRVLIVDDLDRNREIVRNMLEPQGCICFEAPDGEDALEALHAGPMDIVLMDIHMNRLNGVEATRLIRESRAPFADIPIIALTADNAATTNAACMAAGADIFLTKPVMSGELCRALEFLQTGKSRRTLRQVEAG